MNINLKIKKLDPTISLPLISRVGDGAIDLRSNEDVIIPKGEKIIVSTGLAMAIPKGYVGVIKDRSGLAAKNSLHCLAGVIDSNYRGELKIIIINFDKEDFSITKNMRICQIMIIPIPDITLTEINEFEDTTSRGDSKFGSSGLH